MSEYSPLDVINAIAAASAVLSERKEEVNRLNVFPVPDGDTGTNMSLTLESVVQTVMKLPAGADGAARRKAITTGALMGARGNSGVITSQILRGLCEGAADADELNTHTIADAFVRAQTVEFQAVRKPVTVKTRLGWDENSKIIVGLAERLQDTGIQALTIHGRTRCQMYKGEADWTLIGEVKNNPRMHIPIIGNGDINSARKAKEAFDRFGVDGIMVGRASFGHPWIFREIKHYLETGEELPPMSVRDRVALAKWHLSLSVGLKGPVTGVLEMRRHLSCYFKGLPDFKETRVRLVTEPSAVELDKLLDFVGEKWGDCELAGSASVYGL